MRKPARRFDGFVPFDRNPADLRRSIVGNYEGGSFQVLQENLTTELFYRSELKIAALCKSLQHTHFFRVSVPGEQANLLCDELSIFQLGANVRAKQQSPVLSSSVVAQWKMSACSGLSSFPCAQPSS